MTTGLRGASVCLCAIATLASRTAGAQSATPTSGGAIASPRAQGDTRAAVSVRQVVASAVDWLVAHQNADGSWGSHHSPRPIEILASVPGSHDAFRIATTSLGIIALQDAREIAPQGRAALERGLDYLLEHYDVKRASGLEHYNVWSFGYALQCFGERLLAEPDDPRAPAMRAACKRLVEKLGMYQTLDGGWGYLSLDEVPTFQPSETSMSFTTGSIVVGLDRARRAGVELPEKMMERALANLDRSRLPDGAYLYGDYLQYRPRMGINENKGSACRTPCCDYARSRFGGEVSTDAVVKGLEDLLFKHARFQRIAVRRPIPHEAWYSVSGYFYLFGHAYAAYQIEELPPELRARFSSALVERVLETREPDGSFWDYPLYSYHKPYGTAFAVIALVRCEGGAAALAPK